MRRDEEPCVWADEVFRQAAPRRVNGRKVVERFPQTAGNGTLGRRWEKIVDPAGNVVNAPVTTAGSLFDSDDPGSRYIRRKHAALGFFALAKCPVALVAAGELAREAIDESLWKEQPCERGTYSNAKPCPHTVREIELRQAAQKSEWEQRSRKIQAEEDAAQIARDERNELLKGFGEVMTETLGKVLAAKVAPGADDSKPAAKSK